MYNQNKVHLNAISAVGASNFKLPWGCSGLSGPDPDVGWLIKVARSINMQLSGKSLADQEEMIGDDSMGSYPLWRCVI